jgi:hypothetical protein
MLIIPSFLSSEMIPMVEGTGAMAVWHKGFATVAKRASQEYLDRVFVDLCRINTIRWIQKYIIAMMMPWVIYLPI